MSDAAVCVTSAYVVVNANVSCLKLDRIVDELVNTFAAYEHGHCNSASILCV